jgi:hypothetical protein
MLVLPTPPLPVCTIIRIDSRSSVDSRFYMLIRRRGSNDARAGGFLRRFYVGGEVESAGSFTTRLFLEKAINGPGMGGYFPLSISILRADR